MFIKLTRVSLDLDMDKKDFSHKSVERQIYINPKEIDIFYRNGERTIISFSGTEGFFEVKETPEQIMELLEGAK